MDCHKLLILPAASTQVKSACTSWDQHRQDEMTLKMQDSYWILERDSWFTGGWIDWFFSSFLAWKLESLELSALIWSGHFYCLTNCGESIPSSHIHPISWQSGPDDPSEKINSECNLECISFFGWHIGVVYLCDLATVQGSNSTATSTFVDEWVITTWLRQCYPSKWWKERWMNDKAPGLINTWDWTLLITVFRCKAVLFFFSILLKAAASRSLYWSGPRSAGRKQGFAHSLCTAVIVSNPILNAEWTVADMILSGSKNKILIALRDIYSGRALVFSYHKSFGHWSQLLIIWIT